MFSPINRPDPKEWTQVIENSYLISFGLGAGCGVWISCWFCIQLNRFRGPGYYQRRARRVARGAW